MMRDWLFMGGIAFAAVTVTQMGLQTVNAKADGALVDDFADFTCAVNPLGISADTSAHVFGNVSLQYSSFAGKLVAGKAVAVEHSRFGTAIVNDASFAEAPSNMIKSDLQLSAISPTLSGVTKALDSLNVRGQQSVAPAGGEREELFFYGQNAVLNVFSMNSASFETARTLSVEGVPGATTLIIVNGEDVTLKAMAMRVQGINPEGVIFYFPTAKIIRASSMNFKGTVLAPHAVFEVNEVVLAGQVVVQTLRGRLDIRQIAFKGCIPAGT
jgi:choice-of-anchor A domain-containing protein